MDDMDATEQAYQNGYWAGYAAGKRALGNTKEWVEQHMEFTHIGDRIVAVVRVADLMGGDSNA